ncbi:hypothetical protein CAL29_06435 [Bordetella genomosp. 10]|uniref:Uncharacterized protein n=1 Tax=Bordetella genomosp. 10 TaxID=1416804 RepID=A0A261SLR2_9BORD|nr:hypothetical protein CAL29_06435 [Bordetella genomosp. 10]
MACVMRPIFLPPGRPKTESPHWGAASGASRVAWGHFSRLDGNGIRVRISISLFDLFGEAATEIAALPLL